MCIVRIGRSDDGRLFCYIKYSTMKKIRLNLKSIIRWEQLRKKSFSLMNYADKDDTEALLYTTTLCGNESISCTFEVFRQSLINKKTVYEITQALARETAVLNQFQKTSGKNDSGDTDGCPGMIGDLVSTLIISGLDARYALEDMELCDLPMYIGAYERGKRERMEADRMWAFFSMLPHIDSRKMKNGAKDLILFPWEEAAAVEAAEKSIAEDSKKFEYFMKTKKEDYYGR